MERPLASYLLGYKGLIRFKSKRDGREFEIKVPESSEDIESNDFIEINGKTKIVEEILSADHQREELSEKVPEEGELVYGVDEIYNNILHHCLAEVQQKLMGCCHEDRQLFADNGERM